MKLFCSRLLTTVTLIVCCLQVASAQTKPAQVPATAPLKAPTPVVVQAPPLPTAPAQTSSKPAWNTSKAVGLPPVNESILASYRAHPEAIRQDREKIFQVCEAILTQYFNDLMRYYMKMYRMENPPVDPTILRLYTDWMRTLPTPVLVDIARSSTIHHALTISVMGTIALFEKATNRTNSVFAPPPFVVNTTLVGSDGVAVAAQSKIKEIPTNQPMKIVPAETTKLAEQTAEEVKALSERVLSLEKDQKTMNMMLIALGVVAFISLIVGFMGFRAANN